MTTTPKLGLTVPPAPGSRNWNGDRGQGIAGNFQKIDDADSTVDHLKERTAEHGIVVDHKMIHAAQFGTSLTTLEALDDNLIALIMVLGG